MARAFFALVLLAAGVVCLAFYLGWFHLGSEDADGKTNITLTVDKDKIEADKKKALDKVHGVGYKGTAPAPAENGPSEAEPQSPQ